MIAFEFNRGEKDTKQIGERGYLSGRRGRGRGLVRGARVALTLLACGAHALCPTIPIVAVHERSILYPPFEIVPFMIHSTLGHKNASHSRPLPRTVNGTGHTGPSEFCVTSI